MYLSGTKIKRQFASLFDENKIVVYTKMVSLKQQKSGLRIIERRLILPDATFQECEPLTLLPTSTRDFVHTLSILLDCMLIL